jgi:signal transduction histidine kinase
VDETEGYICFTVADNGIGIDENRREHIWGRGISGSESSGLGLAFVQSVVTQMNGIIRMDTKLGKGTSITILLPKENEDEKTDNHSVH